MKQILKKTALRLLLLTILLTLCIPTAGCAGKAPSTEQIYDRVVELIEASYEVNTVFYGAGLPIYPTESKHAELLKLYYGFEYAGDYEMVTEYAKFLSEGEIRAAAERVYSKAYLEDVLYPAAFTGYAVNGISGVQVASARYLESGEWFYQSVKEKALYDSGIIVYDYSTMRVTAPSNDEACFVTLNAWMEDTPENVHEVRIRLVKEEGQWYLDSFTGGVL